MRRLLPFLFLVCFFVAGCRSDADRMAEFCLSFDSAVDAATDCADLAGRVDALISSDMPRFRRDDVCSTSTACLPCRQAVRKMLVQCGYDEALRPVLDKMHFSRTLRDVR